MRFESAQQQSLDIADDLGARAGVGVEPIVRRYSTILADPPWEYPEGFATQSRSPGRWEGDVERRPLPYPSMTVDEIKALPVEKIANQDSRLWLWTTNRYLPHAFDVITSWGFVYRQTLVWHKSDANMSGSVAPNSAEFLLIGVRGTPGCKKKLPAAVIKLSQSKQHSRKPKEWRYLIEQTSEGPRLEMFARQKIQGWYVWGNEFASDVYLSA